ALTKVLARPEDLARVGIDGALARQVDGLVGYAPQRERLRPCARPNPSACRRFIPGGTNGGSWFTDPPLSQAAMARKGDRRRSFADASHRCCRGSAKGRGRARAAGALSRSLRGPRQTASLRPLHLARPFPHPPPPP